MGQRIAVMAILVLCFIVQPRGLAADILVEVTDTDGQPLPFAAVFLTGPDKSGLAFDLADTVAKMDQHDESFDPFVLAVPLGSKVEFTNSDRVNHHVYSFSRTKRVDVVVPPGAASDPLIFDRPGVVQLGCNIHDFMLAYVYVVDGPYFGLTSADGRFVLRNIPTGEFEVHAWHPRKPGPRTVFEPVSIGQSGSDDVKVQLRVRPDRERGDPRASERRRY